MDLPVAVITYYTDPLCCWSWGFEPQWRRLRYAYAGRLAWRIRVGGMIGDWAGFSDPLNCVQRPSQMGPVALEAKHITGMPITADLWVHDPPRSSWPACLAVKAAELQSPQAGEAYLRHLREALMIEGRNIARAEVLADCAAACARTFPLLFDVSRWHAEGQSEEAKGALADDIRTARLLGISRFPTLIIEVPGAGRRVLTGWRPYVALKNELVGIAPDIGAERCRVTARDYRSFWVRVTEREVTEIIGTQ
jgi:putative protein-disulfide isomerase